MSSYSDEEEKENVDNIIIEEEKENNDNIILLPESPKNSSIEIKNNNESDKEKEYEEEAVIRNKDDIFITLTKPVVVGKNISSWVEQILSGCDKLGNFECVKRQTDFFNLRNKLVREWPGIFIPPIPSKNFTSNFEIPFIEKRRKLLETFLVRISTRPLLYYSKPVKEFFRSSDNNKEYIKSQTILNKEDNNDENSKNTELGGIVDSFWSETRDLYKKIFLNFFEMKKTEEVDLKCNKLRSHLLETDKQFASWNEACDKMIESITKVQKSKYNFVKQGQSLENAIYHLKDINDEPQFWNTDVFNDLMPYQDELSMYNDIKTWIEQEKLDIATMLGCINRKNSQYDYLELKTKHLKEMKKQQIKLKQKNNSNELYLLENKISRLEKDVIIIEELCITVENLLVYQEFDLFWSYKQNRWQYNVGIYSSKCGDYQNNTKKFWEGILKSCPLINE